MIPQNQISYLMSKARQDQMQYEAEQARLLKSIKARPQTGATVYQVLLSWIGARMIHLGERLEHYAATPSRSPA